MFLVLFWKATFKESTKNISFARFAPKKLALPTFRFVESHMLPTNRGADSGGFTEETKRLNSFKVGEITSTSEEARDCEVVTNSVWRSRIDSNYSSVSFRRRFESVKWPVYSRQANRRLSCCLWKKGKENKFCSRCAWEERRMRKGEVFFHIGAKDFFFSQPAR